MRSIYLYLASLTPELDRRPPRRAAEESPVQPFVPGAWAAWAARAEAEPAPVRQPRSSGRTVRWSRQRYSGS
jgi:hypothetical protein